MGNASWPRRGALAAMGGAAVACLFLSGCAPGLVGGAPQPLTGAEAAELRFKTIKVDVSPLIDKGLGTVASWMAEDLPARLQAAFAKRLVPGDVVAATLLVRIDGVRLGNSGGGGTQPFGLGGARDDIEGVGSVLAPSGKIIATYPLFTSQIALTGGPVYEIGTERRRVAELANSFAYWLPGQMGL